MAHPDNGGDQAPNSSAISNQTESPAATPASAVLDEEDDTDEDYEEYQEVEEYEDLEEDENEGDEDVEDEEEDEMTDHEQAFFAHLLNQHAAGISDDEEDDGG